MCPLLQRAGGGGAGLGVTAHIACERPCSGVRGRGQLAPAGIAGRVAIAHGEGVRGGVGPENAGGHTGDAQADVGHLCGGEGGGARSFLCVWGLPVHRGQGRRCSALLEGRLDKRELGDCPTGGGGRVRQQLVRATVGGRGRVCERQNLQVLRAEGAPRSAQLRENGGCFWASGRSRRREAEAACVAPKPEMVIPRPEMA